MKDKINPLLKHKILQNLPYELIKNPDKVQIKKYLDKKIQTLNKFKIATIIIFILDIMFLLSPINVHSLMEGMSTIENIANILVLISLPISAYSFHKSQKDHNLSEQEIEAEIKKFKSQ